MRFSLFLFFFGFSLTLFADGPKDNVAENVRPIPPPGIQVSTEDAAPLQEGLKQLRQAIDEAAKTQAKHPLLADLLPDLEIYHKAVDWALRYQEIHKPAEVKAAQELIQEGLERAEHFKKGLHPWTQQKGLVVRAYRSRIDGSVQPYGMVIPDSYQGSPARLDVWCHGRGETLSELSFLDQRRKQQGQISPAQTLVLHPYGRYCCANKFAGEVDLMEALEHAKKFYSIDADRTLIRGFSMGGAAAWQFAVLHADKWCAASPGAGFAETPEFLNVFQSEDVSKIPSYEKKLWHWYNATDNALNLFHVPTVAYSGELDKQKQAADIMERYLIMENMELTHLIGPQTAHKIHPDSLVEIEKRLASIAALGRDPSPREVHFSTYFLRYHRMHWVVVNGLQKHWERSRIHAKISGEKEVTVQTQNIRSFSIEMPAGHCPISPREKPVVVVDGQKLEVVRPRSDRSWTVHFRRDNGQWQQALTAQEEGKLSKKHGLSGPIDDAFMDSFLFVKPTGTALNTKLGAWAEAERQRAHFEWRRQFRGLPPEKEDTAINETDLAKHHLILWGDPSSNALLAKILPKLPVKWTKESLMMNGKTYNSGTHAPICIYPNPLNPSRYIVINSSFTYREYDYLNNARQVPKLPDWAVIHLETPPSSRAPGGVTDAGFFADDWQW